MKRKFIFEVILLIILILGSIVFSFFHSTKSVRWVNETVYHSSSPSPLWTLSPIYMDDIPYQPLLISGPNGKIFFLGSDQISMPQQLISIDGQTGKVIWRMNYPEASVIASSGSIIYVGAGEYVKAFDSTDGHMLWFTRVPTAGVVSIVIREPFLYFATAGAGFYFSIDAKTGKNLHEIAGSFPDWNSVSDEKMIYHACHQPKVSPISNFAIIDHYAYALCEDGFIGRLDFRTGVFENIIQFDPIPKRPIYSSYLAVDEIGHRLFVYLWDSAQLFAYQLKN